MANHGHYTENREGRGPVSEEQLKQRASAGQLTPTDLVWKNGSGAWMPGRLKPESPMMMFEAPKKMAAAREEKK